MLEELTVDLASPDAWGTAALRALAETVATALDRGDDDRVPGHAVMRLRSGDPDEPAFYQLLLTTLVWRTLTGRGVLRRAGSCRLNHFRAHDGALPVDLVGSAHTYKPLHFDPHSLFFSHLYFATHNIAGGDLVLVDVRRYLTQAGLSFEAAFQPLTDFGNEGRMAALPWAAEIMLAEYAVAVPPAELGTPLLVFVRNDPWRGAGHHVVATQTVDLAQPTSREFVRASVAPSH